MIVSSQLPVGSVGRLEALRPGVRFACSPENLRLGKAIAVFTDPDAAGIPVGRGTYEWDGAAGTWFWVDWANDLIFVGMIQRFAVTEGIANTQQLTQKLLAKAIL